MVLISEHPIVKAVRIPSEEWGGGDRMGKHYSANDQRSMAMNPNNSACKASADNRSNQLNSTTTAYESSRKK
jgi:hypothetical protein